MTVAMTPVGALPAPSVETDGNLAISHARVAPAAESEVDPKALEAARSFEAIFVRQLLGSLQKTTQLGGEGPMTSGGGMYSSVVVGALADSVAGGGGIGLAEVVARAMSQGATK